MKHTCVFLPRLSGPLKVVALSIRACGYETERETAVALGIANLRVMGDSMLVVNQVNGGGSSPLSRARSLVHLSVFSRSTGREGFLDRGFTRGSARAQTLGSGVLRGAFETVVVVELHNKNKK